MSITVFLALMAACCGYAAVRGGPPERIAAGLQVAAFALYMVVHRLLEMHTFLAINPWATGVDVALFIALFVLAWRSTRFWPLWVAGWQLATIAAHFAKLLDPAMLPAGYAIQTQFWAYPMLLATAAGAWRHRARIRDGDIDLPWKPLPA